MGRKLAPKAVPYVGAGGKVTAWRVRLRVNGKQTTESFPNEVAANVFIARMLDPNIGPEKAVAMRAREDANSDEYVPTIAELLPRYIESITGIEEATREEYTRLAARSWLPIIGSLRVDDPDLRDDVATKWLNKATGAPKTVKNQKSVLLGLMEYAVGKRYISHNPLTRMRVSRAGEEETEDPKFLTHEEFDVLYAEFGPRDQKVVAWMFGMGTRWGETTAIRKRDIDLAAGQWDGDTWIPTPRAQIVRAWKKGAKGTGGRRIGQPKSKASRRPVIIPAEVVDAIEPMLADLGPDDYVFRTETGKAMTHSNFFNRAWKPATMRASICPAHRPVRCRCFAGKPWLCTVHTERDEKGNRVMPPPCGCPGRLSFRPRIHDARHTHASWLIAQGVRLEVIQERLGHEDYLTTRRLYGHLMPDAQLAAAAAASLAFAQTSLILPRSAPRELA
jgi:integrase